MMNKTKISIGHLQEENSSSIQDWKLSNLGEILELEYGQNLTESLRKNGEVPVFGSNGIVGYHNEPYVKDAGIILGTKGSIDEINFSETGFWPIDTTYFITKNETNLNLRFLSYLLDFLQLERLNAASAIPGLNRNDVYGLKALIPPQFEQRKIASVLYTVDQAIQKTEEIIEQTKRVKKGLMQDLLFGGIGHAEFKEVWVGPQKVKIPVNWQIMKLKDLGEIITGSTSDTTNPLFFGDEYHFITPEDLGVEKSIDRSNRGLTFEGLQEVREIPANSILIVCIGATIGKIAISKETSATNQQINTLVCDDNHDPEFIYYALHTILDLMKAQATNTATPILNKTNFSNYQLAVPPKEEQEKIASILASYDNTEEHSRKKLSHLKRLKKGLMQDLLTGEVRTDDKDIEVLDEVIAHG